MFPVGKLHITYEALGGILKRPRGRYTGLVPLYLESREEIGISAVGINSLKPRQKCRPEVQT